MIKIYLSDGIYAVRYGVVINVFDVECEECIDKVVKTFDDEKDAENFAKKFLGTVVTVLEDF